MTQIIQVRCKDCKKKLDLIVFQGYQPTDEIRCNDCGLKEFDI